MDIRETLGKNLKRIREAYGYTQAHVAEKCGFEVPSYSRWENGKSWPNPETIAKLACLFNCDQTYFYRQDGAPQDLNTHEIGDIAEGAPFDKLLSIVVSKVQAVPTDIIEMAYYFKPSEEAWEEIRGVLDHDIKQRKLTAKTLKAKI